MHCFCETGDHKSLGFDWNNDNGKSISHAGNHVQRDHSKEIYTDRQTDGRTDGRTDRQTEITREAWMSDMKSYSYDHVKSASLMPTECLVKGHKAVNIRQLSHSRLVVQTDVTVFLTLT